MPVNKVKRREPFAALAAGYYEDPRLARAGEKAELVYVRALALSVELRTRVLTPRQLRHATVGMRTPDRHIQRLLNEGLLRPGEGGLRIVRVGAQARAAIPSEVRAFVYERDGWRCQHCGVPFSPSPEQRTGHGVPTNEDGVRLTLDHIVPWSMDGSDDPENLRALCLTCNVVKGAKVEGGSCASAR